MEPPRQMRGAPQSPDQSQVLTYVLTEEEKNIFRECNSESFWYRSLPFSAISMFITQMLVKKGTITTHTRFGSLPKVAFAGLCGFIAGKISYLRICQEKFRNLENSAVGEALKKHRPLPYEYSQKPETSNAPFENVPVPEAPQTPYSSKYSVDSYEMADVHSNYEPVPFTSSMNESSPTGITDSIPQEPTPFLEEGPKRKGVTYEELRSRNRDMYEAGVTQKSEYPSKPSQERALKKAKVNKYGDAWED
ncbi:OCIA domain-containing protein 1 [Rhineura floridana]|uniref:OCIA domain-containing protein 1 n=1 Tax=Rhineura floridana TaxID=261503 RepID=UPI002AC835B7|nr:OCIA domain-containing protein 1 [Rhineura floridana]